MKKAIYIFCCIISYFLSGSCASTQLQHVVNEAAQYQTENFQPLFDYTYNREKGLSRYNILGPFITFEKGPDWENEVFRPFYYDREDKRQDTRDMDIIFPLGNYKRTPEWERYRFTPLLASKRDFKEKKEKKKSFELFPVFWGRTEEGEGYGGIFPVYGNFKKRFGKDEISFYLWPVYMNIKDEGTDTTDFIWPVFSRTTGEKEQGFRMWPLFGYRQKEGEYSKKFFIWPLIHHQKIDLDTSRPTEYSAFLPFYVSSVSPRRISRSVLWPFFNYLYDEDENLTLWDFPWPFIQRGSGENLKVLKIFPIIGFKEKEERKEHFFLWPLYTYKREFPEESERVIHRFLLVSKYEYETSINKTQNSELGTQNSLQLRLWPLFSYRTGKSGETRFNFPEIIPVDSEGFERNYGPLLRFYEYDFNAKGEMESKILWGLYSHKKNDFGEFIDLSFFISYEKRGDEGSFSILKGLLEHGKKNGKNYFKILYLPF